MVRVRFPTMCIASYVNINLTVETPQNHVYVQRTYSQNEKCVCVKPNEDISGDDICGSNIESSEHVNLIFIACMRFV